MYATKTPTVLKALASDMTWNFSREEKAVYLTFDDGPTPEITERTLDILSKFQAKATFFCVGEMAEKSPELLQRIVEDGHVLGNHTMKHENGWKISDSNYFRSYLECSKQVSSNLFRPPYGRISKSQARCIKKRSKIIMWDVLPGDFDEKATTASCLNRLIKNTQNGSIIVLHDSLKCGEKMLGMLPDALGWLTEEGYELKAIR